MKPIKIMLLSVCKWDKKNKKLKLKMQLIIFVKQKYLIPFNRS